MTEQEYLELVEQVSIWDHQYYTLDNPTVTDKKYDEAYNKLVKYENKNPHLKAGHSPTERVGGAILPKMVKKEHTFKLYSLDKANSDVDLDKFFKDVLKEIGGIPEYALEWKLDGLSFVARYEGGFYVEARTRGNGKIGEVVTEQVRTIRNMPLQIPFKGVVEVQGEIVIPLDLFAKYNLRLNNELMKAMYLPDFNDRKTYYMDLYKPFKNPRNAASGAMRQLNLTETAKRPLAAYLYNIGHIEGLQLHTQEEMNAFLVDNGFKTAPMLEIFTDTEKLKKRVLELSAERKKQNFEIDGLVIKVNDLSKREEMGYTARYPKGSISYKFEATEEVTTLNDVKWEVGRTGRVTPIAQLEPVDFGGVVVTKATLNNLLDIENKGVGIGAEVFIRRANDVIPEIMGVVPGSVGTPIIHPDNCPSCGGPTVVEMPFVWCKNTENCTAQSVKMWSHFVSRDAMNIDGLSEKTLETMLLAKKMTKVSDIFYLQKEDLMELDRFGSKKIDNLLESIEKAKDTTWEHFLYALGINLVGKGTAERTNKVFPGYEELKNATYEQLILIDDVGEKVAEEIVNYFGKKENLEEIERMLDAGVTFKVEEKKETTGEYTDKIFVLTGKMIAPRKEMEEKIKSMGGTIGSSVGKKTDFLIYGEDAGSKLEKAAKLGVQTIAEKDFFK